jgi:hypothetical protein
MSKVDNLSNTVDKLQEMVDKNPKTDDKNQKTVDIPQIQFLSLSKLSQSLMYQPFLPNLSTDIPELSTVFRELSTSNTPFPKIINKQITKEAKNLY